MFAWIAGESCKGSCVGSDPTIDTVKFLPSKVNTDQQEHDGRQQDFDERQEQLRLEQERKSAEEAERHRQEKERQERERKERHERERYQQEELVRQREEERLRLEEQRLQDQAEAVRIKAERIEKERVAAQESARKEQEAARQQLQSWLQKNKYASVNAKKTKMMMARYPLHDAVTQKDAIIVRLLLRFGADPALKNTSGRTAQELANSTKGCEAVFAALTLQPSMKMGGA